MAPLSVEPKPKLVTQGARRSSPGDKLLPDGGSMEAVDWGTEAIKLLRSLIKLLIILLFLGSLVLWIIFPMYTYNQMEVRVMDALASFRHLGDQATYILLWTVPMLLISILGCLYLHLGDVLLRDSLGRNEKKDLEKLVWKRPVLVRGPLGIVSKAVYTFLFVFVLLLIWSFSTYAVMAQEETWVLKVRKASLKVGQLGNICLVLLFFPVARGSSVLRLLGLTSEASIKYHMWLGHLVMIFGTVHGVGHIIYWSFTNQIYKVNQWPKLGVSNLAGDIALVVGLVMWATSFACIRRKLFEVFFYTHYLYIVYVVFFFLHVGISFAFMMIPGFYLFMIDRYLRFLQSRRAIRLLSARVFPCGTLELNLAKSPGWDYKPMSVIFINIPSISKLQWHPFTIISSSKLNPEKISIVLKSEGTWTSKLYQMLLSPKTVDHLGVSVEVPTKLHRILSSPRSSVNHLDVFIEGPYGPSNIDHLFLHDILVMVSGGSGITPFISIIRELIFLSKTPNLKLPQIVLVCSFRKAADTALLNLIQPPAGSTSNLQLQIMAYVTREGKPPCVTNYTKRIRTRWLRLRDTDLPISPILGRNNWLWLAAIIISSFIIFLLSMGLITHYYIHSLDHCSAIYSYPTRVAFNVILICVSIVGTTTLAVACNKTTICATSNQVHNMEEVMMMSPGRSPEWRFYDAEKEMGTQFQTQVRYRERPDLKKILLEHIIKGTSVGVLACGPKTMRQEAARVCKSGLADNLHFESISFSW